jgi:hypothetical protein
MTAWWEEPYKGGPMAMPASMFPRPLYPPDSAAKGRVPSVDGPDVIAYKRTIWRAGRWPGPASGFDDTFSNGFSHGRGGNVSETGVAGFQRQMKLDPTGFVGEKTYKALASARVPEGPHEGEMCMDANACNLIALAFEQFAGAPAPEQPAELAREARLEEAIRHLGYVESGNNDTKFGEWYGMNYQPWCAMFVTYCDQLGGRPTKSLVRASRYSYCPYVVSDARAGRYGLSVTTTPQPGDLVVYDWAYDGTYDHIGVFEKWAGGSSFQAVEGNTSPSDYSNGGQVMRVTRSTAKQATTFVRVAEP